MNTIDKLVQVFLIERDMGMADSTCIQQRHALGYDYEKAIQTFLHQTSCVILSAETSIKGCESFCHQTNYHRT